jgi:cytochrome bd-type quinol oxidase subunit 2
VTTDQKKFQPGSPLGHWLSDLKPVAILGFLTYVALRIAYGRFYAQFGLSADDLRPGYVELLTQSTIGVIVMVIVSGLLVMVFTGLAVGYGAFLKGIGDEPLERRLWSRVAGNAWQTLAVIVAIVAMALLLLAKVIGDRRLSFGCSFVLSCYLLVVVALGMIQVRNGLVRNERWWRRLAAAMLLVIGISAAALLIDEANFEAGRVRSGWPSDNTLFGVPLTSWGAQTATLSWTTGQIDPALKPLAESCLMFLGQSDGTLFLYSLDRTRAGAFRVPAALAAVRVIPGRRCQPATPAP